MLSAVSSFARRRPRLIVAVTVALAALAGVSASGLADRLHPYGAEDPESEAVRAAERLERATGVEPGAGLVALFTGTDARSPAMRAKVDGVARRLAADPIVGRVATFYNTRDPGLVSLDGRSTYLVAGFKPLSDKERQDAAARLNETIGPVDGMALGGADLTAAEVNTTIEGDLARAEAVALPIIFLLSLWFFRGLVAALIPPLVGGLAIAYTFLALRLLSEAMPVSVYALNIVTALGLGLAIDYSLLIVARYREELAAGGPRADALQRTLSTAGRTVFFSSLTVAAALASLIIFPQRYLYSMGLGGAIVSAVACVVTLVVLPAVLTLLGHRVNALAPRRLQRAAEAEARPATSGGWYRLSRMVMRRPATVALAATAALLALGAPFLRVELTAADAGVLPAGSSSREVAERLDREFPPNRTEPIQLVAATGNRAALGGYAASLTSLESVSEVRPPRPVGADTALIEVIPAQHPFSDESQDLVHRIRSLPAPFDVAVGGVTAGFVDQKASLAHHLPIAAALIVGSTLVALFLLTGSVVLPIKALIVNALTASAAFGILVLVFQDGRLEGLLGYTSQGALDISQPVLLFALVFGLSTDYGVFLLDRIKEARAGGRSGSESVALGLERTGRIVTAAALLFCVAIGAVVTSKIIFVKQAALGTAVAVLLDATLVRALLVPSLMALLGRRNWWSPQPLRRLHERVSAAPVPVQPGA